MNRIIYVEPAEVFCFSMTLPCFSEDITFDGCGTPQYPVIHRKATIQCRVSGAPTPTVYWRFKGVRITAACNYTISFFA